MDDERACTFYRAFEPKTIERMDAGENVSAPCRELGVKRAIRYRCRSAFRAGKDERA